MASQANSVDTGSDEQSGWIRAKVGICAKNLAKAGRQALLAMHAGIESDRNLMRVCAVDE